MKYRRAASFDHDFSRLTDDHQRMFLRVLREYFLPAVAAGAFTGSPPWPRRLRIHRLTDSAIYSLTWNFSSPDGRATFHLERTVDDVTLLVWRRIGDHSVAVSACPTGDEHQSRRPQGLAASLLGRDAVQDLLRRNETRMLDTASFVVRCPWLHGSLVS